MYHSRWRGTHYQAGYRYGHKMRMNPLEKIEISKERIDYAKACLPIYQKYYPEIIEEIQGIADGLHISSKMIQAFLFSMYAYTSCGCSSIAYADDNCILLGRNSDFLKSIEKLCDSVDYRLEKSYAFIGHTTAWSEIEDGMNDQGLAIGLTFVYPTCIGIGMNAGLLVRYLLEKCRSTQEAIDFLKSVPIGSAQTFTIADRNGHICVVECHCQNLIIRQPSAHMIYTTNHFISEEMKKYHANIQDDIYSHERYKTMENIKDMRFNSEKMKDLLSGKYGFMCQYTGEIDTIWSVVYDIKNKSIERAEGNPLHHAFQKEKRI